MILLDGALIATRDAKIIDTKFVTKEVADAIINEGAKFGIYPFVLSLVGTKLQESFQYATTLNSYQREIIKRYANDKHTAQHATLRAMEQNFKIVYMAEKPLLVALQKQIASIFADEVQYILAPEAYMGCYFLTILHKDANKAHGIESVREAVGFDLQRLSVFGDNYNDIEMFELSQTAIAVANAQEGVQQKADIVLPYTNDEDGVARYLEGIKNAKEIW
jgi:hydroxymethylpyrimidine pyrophosphatase-like HAD family hydrolase